MIKTSSTLLFEAPTSSTLMSFCSLNMLYSMTNGFLEQTMTKQKINVPKLESPFPNRASVLFSRSQIGITENQKKLLILNLNNFFSRQLKKNLNGQKFGNSFIFKLLNVGGNRLKTVYIFSIF